MAEEVMDNVVENTDNVDLPSEDLSEDATKKSKKKGRKKKSNEDNEKFDYIIRDKKVRRKTKNRKRATIILIILALLIMIGAAIWGITNFLEYNNFKIMIDREGQNVLSLSPHANLDNKSEVIYIDGPITMDNITLDGIEKDILKLEESEGSVSNPNMVTGTFYLTNVTDKARTYMESIYISNSTRGIEKAIRILVISTHFDKDGNIIEDSRNVACYAHMGTKTVDNKTIPSPELVVPLPSNRRPYHGYEILHRYEIEKNYEGSVDAYIEAQDNPPIAWVTTPFASENIVVEKQGGTIHVGEKIRYSIAIWIEGYDKDTTNDKLGGQIKLDFKFSDSGIVTNIK